MAISSTTWQKGRASANPGGRPKALHDVQELARQHAEAPNGPRASIMHDEKAPHSARRPDPEALLSRGWGRPILPTVQTTAGQTFEEWLDTLNDQQKRAFEEGRARMKNGDLADRDASDSA